MVEKTKNPSLLDHASRRPAVARGSYEIGAMKPDPRILEALLAPLEGIASGALMVGNHGLRRILEVLDPVLSSSGGRRVGLSPSAGRGRAAAARRTSRSAAKPSLGDLLAQRSRSRMFVVMMIER